MTSSAFSMNSASMSREPGVSSRSGTNSMRLTRTGRRRSSREAKAAPGHARPVVVSALTGQGIATLLEQVEACLATGRIVLEVDVPPEDGASLAWLHETCEVLKRSAGSNGVTRVTLRISPERADRVVRRFPDAHAPQDLPATGAA